MWRTDPRSRWSLLLPAACAHGLRGRRGRREAGGRGVLLPAAVRRRADRRGPRRGHQPDRAGSRAARPRALAAPGRARLRAAASSSTRRGCSPPWTRRSATTVPTTWSTPPTRSTSRRATDETACDPHFWLDPTLLAEAADGLHRRAWPRPTPTHAADFEASNARLQADLEQLDGDFRTGLADCTTRTVVVSHDAFGYLGERYDLDVHAIAGLSPDAEPSARQLGRAGRPDPRRTTSPPCSASAWPAPSWRTRSPPTSASTPRCSTRSRDSPRRGRGRRLPRA